MDGRIEALLSERDLYGSSPAQKGLAHYAQALDRLYEPSARRIQPAEDNLGAGIGSGRKPLALSPFASSAALPDNHNSASAPQASLRFSQRAQALGELQTRLGELGEATNTAEAQGMLGEIEQLLGEGLEGSLSGELFRDVASFTREVISALSASGEDFSLSLDFHQAAQETATSFSYENTSAYHLSISVQSATVNFSASLDSASHADFSSSGNQSHVSTLEMARSNISLTSTNATVNAAILPALSAQLESMGMDFAGAEGEGSALSLHYRAAQLRLTTAVHTTAALPAGEEVANELHAQQSALEIQALYATLEVVNIRLHGNVKKEDAPGLSLHEGIATNPPSLELQRFLDAIRERFQSLFDNAMQKQQQVDRISQFYTPAGESLPA